MNAVTVAEIIRDVVQRALGDDAKSAPSFLPSSLLLRWIAESYRLINARTKILHAEFTGTLEAVADGPTDIQDRLVTSAGALRIKPSGAWVSMKERTWDYVRQLWPDLDGADTAEVPDSWAWDDRASGKLLILPPPQASVANGLKLDYVQDPGALERLYDPDTATCSITTGSATVTFGASIAGRVLAGDAFGVKADAESLPSSWIKVLSVDNATTITLASVYEGVTDAAALFTLSQVSPIEYRRPGLVRFAPSEYVLAKYTEREEGPQAAAGYYGAFEAEIRRIAIEAGNRPGIVHQGLNARIAYPALRGA